MKHLMKIWSAVAVVCLAMALPVTPALAQNKAQEAAQPAVYPIVVLDVQRVLRDSAAGKSAAKQLADLRSKYQTEIAKSEEQLRTEQQELGRQRSLLAPEVFDERRRAFEEKLQSTQRLVQEHNGALEMAQRQAREAIGRDVITIVTELMKERGFSVVLDRAQIVASDAQVDITKDVLERLDKRLPSVKVSSPAKAPSTAKK